MKVGPPPADILAGMLVYVTQSPRIDARIRVAVEDFAVEELIELGEDGSGPYPIYKVEKRGMGTLDAAAVMERAVRGRVSYAGLKDKRAVAIQYMGPTSKRSASPAEVRDEGLRADLFGHYASPVRRGMMLGNRFRIAVKSGSAHLRESVEEAYVKCRNRELPNFFGYQRFGLKADTNQRVGKAILRKDFAGAVSLLVGESRVNEAEDIAGARRMFREGKYAEAMQIFSQHRYLESRVMSRLIAREDDHLGALRSLPITLRKLFVNSYQAYIFNKVLSMAVERGIKIARAVPGDNWARLAPDQLRVGKVHGVREEPDENALPLVQLVGYAFRDYGSRFDRLIIEQLRIEGTEPRQFYVKEADEMSSEGGFRHAPLIARDLNYSPGTEALVLDFSLSKGEYATTLLREVLKPENPLESGF
jgi:tRNA pseudouridine13 synthase